MITNKDIQALLRMNKHEIRILNTLSSAPKRPSEVVRASNVPNATAYLAFSTLQKRGLAEKRKTDRKVYWLRADSYSLEKLLSSTINELEHIKESSVFEIQHKEDTSIIVHRGDNAIRKVILGTLTLHPNERFSIFQSSNRNDGWLRVFGLQNILKVNNMLRDKKIIGESFIPEDYFSRLIPLFGKKWADSYVDRMNIVYLIPPQFFPSSAEILLFRDRAILFHVDGEIAVEIKNKQILLMIKMIFEYLKTTAKKVDPHQFLKDSF